MGFWLRNSRGQFNWIAHAIDRSEIDWVQMRHEEAGAFAAAAEALFTGRLTACPPFVAPEAVVGMAVYSAMAMLHGKGHDVWEMMVENIP